MAKKPSEIQKPKVTPKLPRALDPNLKIERTGADLYKAGMHAELQKFGNIPTDSSTGIHEPDSDAEVIGLDLTVSEDKALSAIQILLGKTDYQGNLPGEKIQSAYWRHLGSTPVLSFTWHDYFRAYGLEEKSGRIHVGRQAQEARKALKTLAKKPFTIIYFRKRWVGEGRGRKQDHTVVKFTGTLITLVERYSSLEQREISELLDGRDIKKRATELAVTFNPILVDGIDDFYLLKPTDLHREIQQLSGRKRVSRSLSLFIEWLLTKNTVEVRIDREKLAERLRLGNLVRDKKQARLALRLKKCFAIAMELGYLLGSSETESGVLVLKLNPERCKRVSSPGKEDGSDDNDLPE